jgi:hypothetical protein
MPRDLGGSPRVRVRSGRLALAAESEIKGRGAEGVPGASPRDHESPPQLSREYRRMLGAPPRQDVAALKVATQPGIAPAFNVTVRFRAPDLRQRRLFQPRCRRRKSLLTTGAVDREPRPLASSVPISSRRSTVLDLARVGPTTRMALALNRKVSIGRSTVVISGMITRRRRGPSQPWRRSDRSRSTGRAQRNGGEGRGLSRRPARAEAAEAS